MSARRFGSRTLLATVVALALLPASAQATLLVSDAETGNGIAAGSELTLAGSFKFDSEGVGIQCEAEATLAAQDATSLQISEFAIDTESCEGFGFRMGSCVVTEDSAGGLPWSASIADAESLAISGLEVQMENHSCLLTELSLQASSLSAKADDPDEIESLSLAGVATLEDNLGTHEADISGELQIQGEDAGTYAISESHRITHEGTAIGPEEQIDFQGTAKLEIEGIGLQCQTLLSYESQGPSAGEADLQINTESCEGFGFGMSKCATVADSATGAPWDTHLSGADRLSLTGVQIDLENEECLLGEIDLSLPEVVATLDDPESIGAVSLSGEGLAETDAGNGDVSVSGTLSAVGGDADTYDVDDVTPHGKECVEPEGGSEGAESSLNIYDVETESTIRVGETLELCGSFEFTAGGTGINCQTHITLEVTGTEALTATQFETTAETCEGFGLYEGCEVVSPESNIPWNVAVTEEDLDIQEVEYIAELEGDPECLFTFTYFSAEEAITAAPLNIEGVPAGPTEPIYAVELETSPEGENCNDFGCLNMEPHGILEVVGEDAGTYALE